VEADANARLSGGPPPSAAPTNGNRPPASSSVDHVFGREFDVDANVTRGGGREKLRVQDFIQEIGRHRLILDDTRRTRQRQKPS
jgi:hypothetical protein